LRNASVPTFSLTKPTQEYKKKWKINQAQMIVIFIILIDKNLRDYIKNFGQDQENKEPKETRIQAIKYLDIPPGETPSGHPSKRVDPKRRRQHHRGQSGPHRPGAKHRHHDIQY
jgi:hypothetical protein